MAGFFEFYHNSGVTHVQLNHATHLKNHQQLFAGCLSLSIMMYHCSKHDYQLEYKQNSPIFKRKVLPGYVINPKQYVNYQKMGPHTSASYYETHNSVLEFHSVHVLYRRALKILLQPRKAYSYIASMYLIKHLLSDS